MYETAFVSDQCVIEQVYMVVKEWCALCVCESEDNDFPSGIFFSCPNAFVQIPPVCPNFPVDLSVTMIICGICTV